MDNSKNVHFLTVKDHSVSGEIFQLYHDHDLDMLITSPQPELDELGRYYESEDYISHTDGKRSLFERGYQFVKNIAIKNKIKLINSQSQKGKILDIGTGTGDFLAMAKNDGWETIGFEPSDKARAIAMEKGVSFVKDTSEVNNNSIDVITMWHVLEHVPDPSAQIKELKRLLKPDGTIIIAVPNFKSYDAKIYGNFWAAYDVPRHLWHYSKSSIQNLFAKENIELKRILPMKFDAFYVCLLSEKYKTGKMNPFKAFINGWRSNSNAKQNLEYSSHIYVLKNAEN